MHIDGRALARAADQLDTALRHVDAAQRIDAPLALGGARAPDSVDAALANAYDLATSASRGLQHGGSATADARIAVDRLAAEIDTIRSRGDVIGVRNGDAFRALRDAARSGARSLDELRWIGERESILADADAARRAWDALGEVLAKTDQQIEVSDLLRIRRILDLPDSVRPDVARQIGSYTLDAIIEARWLPRERGSAHAFLQVLRRRLSIERLREEGAMLGSDPAVTVASFRERVHRIVAKPDAEVTVDDLRQLALMDELPMQLRPSLPDDANAYSRHQLLEEEWLPGRVFAADMQFASLRRWSDRTRLIEDPHVTKQTLTGELDAMLAKPDSDINIGDLRRLAVYDGLPPHLRPALPPPTTARRAREKMHSYSWLPSQVTDAKAEFANLRLFRAAALRSRESNTAEAIAIIDKPNDQLTRSDAQRLTLLEALPADRRPDIPPTAQALTRDTLTEHVARIALKPQEQVTRADLERVAIIDHLPVDLRPALPPPASDYDRSAIAARGWLPLNDAATRAEYSSLRRWAMLETESGRATARQRAIAGELSDPLTLESLARGGEETLRRVGLSSDDLLRHALSGLRATSPTDLDAIDSSLKLSKQLLAGIPDSGEVRQLATGATELIDLNIRRIAGKVSDGFGKYPDHAEIGRAIEQAELVLALRAATPQGDRAANAAARAADPLPW